jgi:hypothetical protein
VKHVDSIPWGEASDDPHRFAFIEPDHVLQSDLLIRQDAVTFAARATDDLEVDLKMLKPIKQDSRQTYKMNMYRVCPTTRRVLQLPNFDCAPLWFGEHTLLWTSVPVDSVDNPLTSGPLKFESAVDT